MTDDELRAELLSLSPQEVIFYMCSHGWTITETTSGWQVLAYRGAGLSRGTEVVVPLDKGYSDYVLRISEALDTVGRVEGRSIVEVVLRDVQKGDDK
ncbi:MAG: hypothetical protein M0Z41_06370 [Peptococcaceae bacterium]|nr:hypothetical protein [Peptococcaceae bacterium]